MLARTIEGKSYKRTYVRLDGIAPALIASVIASEDVLVVGQQRRALGVVKVVPQRRVLVPVVGQLPASSSPLTSLGG